MTALSLRLSLLPAVALLAVFLPVQVQALCEQGTISIIENSVIALFDGTPLTFTSFTCPRLQERAKSRRHIARQGVTPVPVCNALEPVNPLQGEGYVCSHSM
jgi:hypothetical protein